MSESTNSTAASRADVAVLGLGAMGSALAAALLESGHHPTVWNRTPGRDAELLARGAAPAHTVRQAVTAGSLVVACLYDHASVHTTLDPVAEHLRGRTLVNLTTVTPDEARELATWAHEHGIDYLDGAIMAVPPMIGSRDASILYSGSHAAYERFLPLFEVWATSTYDGEDAGLASLFDLAMLSGMYTMFAGFLHGAAMTGSANVSAREYAARTTPFLAAMTGAFASFAATVDDRDYTAEGQTLAFTEPVLTAIARASEAAGIDPAPVAMVRTLSRRQLDAGHDTELFQRIYESFRQAPEPELEDA